MLGERGRVVIRAELVQEARRPLDVREEKGDGAGRQVGHGTNNGGSPQRLASEPARTGTPPISWLDPGAGKHAAHRLGIAFFASMHRAYLHTPGVELTVVSRGSKRAVFGHFLFQLRGGRVVAEEFAGSGDDPNRLVARQGGPTQAWKASRKCWRRVPSADQRTLAEVGLPYPYPRTGVKAMGRDATEPT
jgi:hypothetical protein